jgi:CheY-like chemotaxis protein
MAQGERKNWRELCKSALGAKDPDELLKILQELKQALKSEEQVRRDFREAMRTISPGWNPMLTTIGRATIRVQISITEEPIRMNEIRVLCVENHPEYMGALKYMLERAGYEVTPATTGDQALRLLTTLHVDGVLLEHDLPDVTGSALRAEMKRIKPDVPVLMFAGIGSQTPFLLRFLDAYLRNLERPESVLRDLEG